MTKLTLLSLNCFDISIFSLISRKRRLTRLAREIIALSPDVICLQEINFIDTATVFRTLFREAGYTVFPDQFTFRIFNHGGLLTATRLPIESATYVKFADQGSIFALDIIERVTKRGYHRMTVKPHNAKPVTIINTHLHYTAGGFYSKKISPLTRAQYEQIQTHENLSESTIFTGDFNILPANRLYTAITGLMRDPLAKSKESTVVVRNTHRRFLPKSEGRIDYTFLSRDLAPRAIQRVIFKDPVQLEQHASHHLSDHFGIWTTVQCP